METTTLLSLLASSAGFTAGSFFLKRYADLGSLTDLICAFAVFACTNLIYARVLAKGLGQGAVLSSMSQVILLSALGALVFGERLNAHQLAGLGLAIGSIWLFAQSGGTRTG
jgi:drug/metabolite transporter (DMT)-like permease